MRAGQVSCRHGVPAAAMPKGGRSSAATLAARAYRRRVADLQRGGEHRRLPARRSRRRCPTPTCWSSTTTAPTARRRWPRRSPSELGRIKVLHRAGKQGLGAAYRHGFTTAFDEGYEAIVSMDSDFSHDPAVIPTMLQLVADGADAVIGSRYVPGGATVDWPLRRRLLSKWGNRYTAAVLRLPVRDCTSGFRAYRADALASHRPGIDDRRGLRLPDRVGPQADRQRSHDRRDPDRLPRSPVRHVEDVGPDHRRVDAARHQVGPVRPHQAYESGSGRSGRRDVGRLPVRRSGRTMSS